MDNFTRTPVGTTGTFGPTRQNLDETRLKKMRTRAYDIVMGANRPNAQSAEDVLHLLTEVRWLRRQLEEMKQPATSQVDAPTVQTSGKTGWSVHSNFETLQQQVIPPVFKTKNPEFWPWITKLKALVSGYKYTPKSDTSQPPEGKL